MNIMKNTKDEFVNAFIREMHTTNRIAVMSYRIEITHQTHVMALRCTKEDPIIRVCRNLLEYDCGGLCILHERRLEIALLLKALGVSAGIFGDPKPSFERSWILA
jgi:hypothetical protein